MDWNLAIALIVLFTSIISPILVAIINNHHQLKLLERERMVNHKLDVIENYLKYAAESSAQLGVSKEFLHYSTSIFLYTPSEIHPRLAKLNESVTTTKFSDETKKLLFDVAAQLRKENKIG